MKSPYSDYHAFIIRPASGKGCVTLKDQAALGFIFQCQRAKWRSMFFDMERREEKLQRIMSARLSKPMLVTEITDRQYMLQYKLPETIPGTGIHATAKQLADSFVVA